MKNKSLLFFCSVSLSSFIYSSDKACVRKVQRCSQLKSKKDLWGAASHGDLDRVKELVLEKKIPVDKRDKEGSTALLWAIRNNKEKIAQFLLSNHANPNVSDDDGMTPLHTAALRANDSLIKILLDAGAAINQVDNYRHRTAVNWLLRMREGAQKKNGKQNSPEQTCKALMVLLAHGADVYIPDKAKRTPLYWAHKKQWATEYKMMEEVASRNRDLPKVQSRKRLIPHYHKRTSKRHRGRNARRYHG